MEPGGVKGTGVLGSLGSNWLRRTNIWHPLEVVDLNNMDCLHMAKPSANRDTDVDLGPILAVVGVAVHLIEVAIINALYNGFRLR